MWHRSCRPRPKPGWCPCAGGHGRMQRSRRRWWPGRANADDATRWDWSRGRCRLIDECDAMWATGMVRRNGQERLAKRNERCSPRSVSHPACAPGQALVTRRCSACRRPWYCSGPWINSRGRPAMRVLAAMAVTMSPGRRFFGAAGACRLGHGTTTSCTRVIY